jgi:hypothetical protein
LDAIVPNLSSHDIVPAPYVQNDQSSLCTVTQNKDITNTTHNKNISRSNAQSDFPAHAQYGSQRATYENKCTRVTTNA